MVRRPPTGDVGDGSLVGPVAEWTGGVPPRADSVARGSHTSTSKQIVVRLEPA